MIVNARGRRGLGRLACALTAGALAVGAVGLAATSGAAATTGTAGAAGTPVALAGVPWSKVGPGWELAEYTAGRPPGDTAARRPRPPRSRCT